MDEVLAILTLLAEILMVWQCLQIVFGKTAKFDKYMVGIIVIDLAVYTLINRRVIPLLCTIILYVLIFLFCYYKFKYNIAETVIRLIVSFSLVGCVEGMAAFIPHIFRSEDNSRLLLFLSSVLALVLMCIIKKFIPILINRMIKAGNGWKLGVTIFYGGLLAGLLINYYSNKNVISIYVVFLLVFLMFIFYSMHRLEQAHNEIVRKNYELELHKVYGGTYEKLLSEVRKRQHDYKNQLSAILGMHLTARSLDELVNMQQEYEKNLRFDCKFDSILTCCNNKILAGFIYYRCVSCEDENIVVDYKISIDQAECCFALHEIIEILGILIDNACENVKIGNFLDKRIGLDFKEEAEKIVFSVSNPARYISFSEIDKMFIHGYSTKGENRGIGLGRVLELVNKYAAEIKVYNSALGDEGNWVYFVIEINK